MDHDTKGEADMSKVRKQAKSPEELTQLFTELANAGDAAGLADLYEPGAVLAYPPGQMTAGREGIRAVYERMVAMGLKFETEETLPTIRSAKLALTSTHRRDGIGVRVQVARQQRDGSWLRVIDRPETPPAGT
jgi:ketosteroid isomerase-like protein